MSNKTDEQVLFPEQDIEGYKVRPWTFGQAVDLAPTLDKIVSILKQEGVGDYVLSLASKGKDLKVEEELGMMVSKISGLVPKLLPHAPNVVMVSLGIKEDEWRAMSLSKATALFLGICTANMEYLKNFYGPVKERHTV